MLFKINLKHYWLDFLLVLFPLFVLLFFFKKIEFISSYFFYFLSILFFAYIFHKREKYIQEKLNEDFFYLIHDYNEKIKEKNLIDTKLAMYNKNIDIMFNIYNISRKIIIVNNSKEILDLTTEFLDKVFNNTDYFVFDYDVTNNYFNPQYVKKNITEDVIRKFKIKFLKHFFDILKADFKIILFDKNSENWDICSDIFQFAEAVMFIPLANNKNKNFIKFAVIVFSGKEYLDITNFEYLDIFSTQMAMGMEKVRIYEEVQEKSIRDSLTNLYKRSFLDEKLDYEIKRSKRDNNKFAFLLIDIDYFKSYNDKYGHLIGDEVLVQVSKILQNSLYETDVISRYGGEEFVVLLPMIDRKQAFSKAEKIRSAIENAIFFDYKNNEELSNEKITVSIGLSCFSQDGETQQVLFENADNALYYAKNNGRNRVVDYLEVKKIFGN
jgi:diguanylate cyclase (GGDEF)-like protein